MCLNAARLILFELNLYEQIEKIKNRTPKNQKFENLRKIHTRKLYFDLGPKRYLGRRDPFIESMG